jgi:hypothetical protein
VSKWRGSSKGSIGGSLDELGFKLAAPADLGRPGYNPALHLKLYVFDYLNRIQSSPAPRARVPAQSRGHVAARTARSRPQDDCRFPQGQRRSDHKGMCSVRRALPPDGPTGERERCDAVVKFLSRFFDGFELRSVDRGESRCGPFLPLTPIGAAAVTLIPTPATQLERYTTLRRRASVLPGLAAAFAKLPAKTAILGTVAPGWCRPPRPSPN